MRYPSLEEPPTGMEHLVGSSSRVPGPLMSVWRWVDERLYLSALFKSTLTEYMVPANLNFWHTLGSILVACFVIQIVTGMLLLVYYVPDAGKAFDSVRYITDTVPYGWLVRRIHALTSHIFILTLMLHLLSTLYMRAYKKPRELQWMSGMVLLGLVMGAALTGYLLPWSQLSYWATTVATNSAASIPKIGHELVVWLRGTPKVSQYTLGRSFAAHVSIIPFTILMVIGIHLLFLRLTGISVPGGIPKEKAKKVPFWPHMITKDLCMLFAFLALLNLLIFYFPQLSFPEDTLKPANPLETPLHIKPEWYFLANYQTLKLVPNEFAGIMLQVALGGILFFLPFLDHSTDRHGTARWFVPVVTTVGVIAYVGLLVWGNYS